MTQGKVISLKMMVTEMGDRGSKSVIYFFLPQIPRYLFEIRRGSGYVSRDRIRLLL